MEQELFVRWVAQHRPVEPCRKLDRPVDLRLRPTVPRMRQHQSSGRRGWQIELLSGDHTEANGLPLRIDVHERVLTGEEAGRIEAH